MVSQRLVVTCVAVTLLVSLYSLSELHTLSKQHAQQDASPFMGQPDSRLLAQTEPVAKQSASIHASAATKAAPGASHTVASAEQRKCYTYPHTELWGEVVVWGTNHFVNSAEECCSACRDFKPATAEDITCNVWVYCGEDSCKEQKGQCWLKHLAHPEASRPAKEGPDVMWTSGTMDVDMNADPAVKKVEAAVDHNARRFHIVTSAQGAAVHWQARVHYYWYKKQKARCEKEGGCEMGGFTRLLHSGKPDDLMDEIPTMVVDPLPQDMVEHSWYVVLNRPYAFVQWVQKAQIPEKYVLMSEPDHIFLRPLPNFMTGETPAAFPFFYIEPAKRDHAHITQKFAGKLSKQQLEQIAPVGNSPTYLSMSDMTKIMPIWMNTSIAIFKDTEANQAWGWVQEMYGYTIAAYLAGVRKTDLFLHMMAQPPWDTKMELSPTKPFYILHYTYGMDYTKEGVFTPGKYGEWRFDKRTWGGKPITRNLGAPPAGMKNDLVRALIDAFNEATDAIPCWTEYAEAGGVVPKECKEAPKHYLAEEAAAKAKAL